MQPDTNPHIDHQFIDAILEKPIPFTLNGRFFYLYQPSLGVSLLSTQLLHELHLDHQLSANNQPHEVLQLCSEQRDLILRIVALHTFSRRADAMREERIQTRMQELQPLDDAELATLIITILQWDNRLHLFTKHLHLDKEQRTREKIAALKKKKGNNLIFGGKSLYGTLLDTVCQRYHWDYGYALWGVTLININLLLADSVQTLFITSEEAKQAHISTDGVYIDARDPNNIQEIQRLIRGL